MSETFHFALGIQHAAQATPAARKHNLCKRKLKYLEYKRYLPHDDKAPNEARSGQHLTCRRGYKSPILTTQTHSSKTRAQGHESHPDQDSAEHEMISSLFWGREGQRAYGAEPPVPRIPLEGPVKEQHGFSPPCEAYNSNGERKMALLTSNQGNTQPAKETRGPRTQAAGNKCKPRTRGI